MLSVSLYCITLVQPAKSVHGHRLIVQELIGQRLSTAVGGVIEEEKGGKHFADKSTLP